jgi:hypothetical protein
MGTIFARKATVFVFATLMSVTVNGFASEAETEAPVEDSETELSAQPGLRQIPFRVIESGTFGRQTGSMRQLITSRGEYRTIIGSDPPRDLDFRHEWVIFLSAGIKFTGGYEASIARILQLPGNEGIAVNTILFTPGPSCLVTQALTNPYVVVRFPRPETARRATFTLRNRVRNC